MNRITLILTGLIAAAGLTCAFAADDPFTGVNFEASHVTLDLHDRPLTEAARQLAEQSGNSLLKPSKNTPDVPVTLQVTDMPYWQAVDELCRAVGMIRGWAYLRRAGKLEAPVAYRGPVVVYVEELKSEIVFRRERPPDAPEALRPLSQLYYRLEYQIEERLPLTWHRGRLTRVTDNHGKPVAVADENWTPGFPRAPVPGFVRTDTRPLGTIFLSPRQLPPHVKTFGTVEGVVETEFGTGERRVVVADPFDRVESRLEADRFIVTVQGLRMRDKNAVMRVKIVAAERFIVRHFRHLYGVFLIGADGTRYPLSISSSRNAKPLGREELVKSGIHGEIGPEGGEEIQLGAYFYRVDVAKGPWSLVCVQPEKYVRKGYPFVLRDVPMP